MNKIFEYAIIYHQLQTKEEKEKGEKQKSKMLVPPTHVLAASEREALITANRAIPEEYVNLIEQVEVAIRPF